MALARAHDLLTREGWRGASLAEVVRGTLAPHGDGDNDGAGRWVAASAPEVRLAPGAAVAMHMAFHELATNAAKYGALSVPGGRVEVAWGPTADGRALHLSWAEHGGPTVEAPPPPSRRGFGSGLLERGLARQLGGEVVIEFPRHGLRCRARLPLSERIALR